MNTDDENHGQGIHPPGQEQINAIVVQGSGFGEMREFTWNDVQDIYETFIMNPDHFYHLTTTYHCSQSTLLQVISLPIQWAIQGHTFPPLTEAMGRRLNVEEFTYANAYQAFYEAFREINPYWRHPGETPLQIRDRLLLFCEEFADPNRDMASFPHPEIILGSLTTIIRDPDRNGCYMEGEEIYELLNVDPVARERISNARDLTQCIKILKGSNGRPAGARWTHDEDQFIIEHFQEQGEDNVKQQKQNQTVQ